jgi:hypothetical protein
MNREQVEKLIARLEVFQRRPHLFLGDTDIKAACVFLGGFAYAIMATFEMHRNPATLEEVIRGRGWNLPMAAGPGIEHQMVEKGMSQSEVIAELTRIEIEVLRRAVI